MYVVGHNLHTELKIFSCKCIKGTYQILNNVIDIGTITTPMGYWAQYFLKIKGLLTVTASHNPVG